MRTITIGVDLAKQVFSVCSVDAAGRVQERRELRRDAFSVWRTCLPGPSWRWRPAAVRTTGRGVARTTGCSPG